MEINNNLMSQLTLKFPFKTKYYEQDFYVSSNNFSVFKLIEDWPNWPSNWVNIHGPEGSGKTHLSNILNKKIKNTKIIDATSVDNKTIASLDKINCLIIENYTQNIDEKLLYSILNHVKQLNLYVLINSYLPIQNMKFSLRDLSSRAESFINVGIELPTDDLLKVIISKYFSEKQIDINPKITDYIIKNIERSYQKVFKLTKEIDDLSLSSGKSININLIKKVLINE